MTPELGTKLENKKILFISRYLNICEGGYSFPLVFPVRPIGKKSKKIAAFTTNSIGAIIL